MGLKLSERKGFSTPADKPVRMYPNNGLKQPVHDYDTTFSAVTLMKEVFFTPGAEKK
jgi:hypothetical protein